MQFRFTRTVLKNIGIGTIVDEQWRIDAYSHTGRNAIAHRVDHKGKTIAPFTRVLLIHSSGEYVGEKV